MNTYFIQVAVATLLVGSVAFGQTAKSEPEHTTSAEMKATRRKEIYAIADKLRTTDAETIASEQRIRLRELQSVKRALTNLIRQFGANKRAIEDELEKDAEQLSHAMKDVDIEVAFQQVVDAVDWEAWLQDSVDALQNLSEDDFESIAEHVEAGVIQLKKALKEAAKVVAEATEDQLQIFADHFDDVDLEKALRELSNEMETQFRKVMDEVNVPQTDQTPSATDKVRATDSVSKERLDKVKRLDNLRKRYRLNYGQVQEKSDAVQSLAEQLGTLDNETIAAQQRIQLQELRSTKHELDFLRRSLNEAIGELTLLQINAQFGTHAPSEHAIQDELKKDAEFLSLRYQISQFQDALDAQASVVRPGSPALNELQQEIALLQRKQDNLREVLTPRVIERLKRAEGESDIDRQKALLLQRATVQNFANQVQQADQDYRVRLEAYRELGGSSGDLQARKAELMDLRKATQHIHAQIKALELKIEREENADDQRTHRDEKDMQSGKSKSTTEQNQPFSPEEGESSDNDVETIVRQIRVLLKQLEKANSEKSNAPTR